MTLPAHAKISSGPGVLQLDTRPMKEQGRGPVPRHVDIQHHKPSVRSGGGLPPVPNRKS